MTVGLHRTASMACSLSSHISNNQWLNDGSSWLYRLTWLNLFLIHCTKTNFEMAQWTYHEHCHLCPTRYTFSTSEALEVENPCPRTKHQNNVPILRGEKHYIFHNFAPSGIGDGTAGSGIDKAPCSNHYAMSLSMSMFLTWLTWSAWLTFLEFCEYNWII